MQQKLIPVILGPTSSGKTSLAIELCKKIGGEIISADSRQIYKEMDIGTGKLPTSASFPVERKDVVWFLDGVKVWGYDLVSPQDTFSSYDFAKFALEKAQEVIKESKTPVIVGGTGFYIDMITGRIQPSNIKPDKKLRDKLSKLSLSELQEKLQNLDDGLYKKTDQQNPPRLIRAIERALASDKGQKLPYLTDVKYVLIGLQTSREKLYARVDTWLEDIWQAGLLDETRSLLDKYTDSPKLDGIVYRSAKAFINKGLSEKEAKQKAKYNLHAYIRRQQTYFKKMPVDEWFDISQDNILEKVYNKING